MENKYFINYASNGFTSSQEEGLKAAENFGFKTKGFSEKDIDPIFFDKNKKILEQKRGSGYWLWKPYIILNTLKKINYGDYLVYMDSGAKFVKEPSLFLNEIDEKGILGFSMIHQQIRWTKGDCFKVINKNVDDFKYEKQLQGTYIFFKKCDYSVNFVENWLNFCQMENLITDSPNIYFNNFPEFIEHRHDQSIFSLLCYNNGIKYCSQIDQYCVEHGYTLDRKYVDRHGRRF